MRWVARDTLRRRLDPEARLGLRLTLSLLAVGLVVVPFLLLVLLIEDNWSPLRHLDRGAARALNNAVWNHPAVVDVLKAVSTVFGPTTFRIVALLLAMALMARRRYRLALFVVAAVGGGSLLDGAAKLATGRHRPVLDHPVAHAPGLSFPSGHALGSLVGVGALLLVLMPAMHRRARVAATLGGAVIVLAVGFSRVALGVHYASDVIGGWTLGAAWLLMVTAAFTTWRRETGRPVDISRGIEPEAAPDLSLHASKHANVRRTGSGPSG